MTQKPSVQTFSRNCCWDAPKDSEDRLGPCWSDVWFQDSVFTDERAMNKNENKKKYFSGLSSLATPNGFGVCDWYQFLITKHLLPTIAQPKNYLLSSASTVFSRVTYETSKNYSDTWKRLLTLPEAAWNEGQSHHQAAGRLELHTRTSGRLSRFGLL